MPFVGWFLPNGGELRKEKDKKKGNGHAGTCGLRAPAPVTRLNGHLLTSGQEGLELREHFPDQYIHDF